MKHLVLHLLVVVAALVLSAGSGAAHCEIPCGIYDDQLRLTLLREHTATIKKSMEQITELEKATPLNTNQLVRWVTNKEQHADELQHIVSQYFLTQRIKPDATEYAKKVSLLHQMLIEAMKAKQTTDLSHVDNLTKLIGEFEKIYTAK